MLSHVPRCMSLPSLNVVPCPPLHGPSVTQCCPMFPAAWAFRHSMLSHVPRCMGLPSLNVVPCPPLHGPSVTQCCPMFPAAWAFRHTMLSHALSVNTHPSFTSKCAIHGWSRCFLRPKSFCIRTVPWRHTLPCVVFTHFTVLCKNPVLFSHTHTHTHTNTCTYTHMYSK